VRAVDKEDDNNNNNKIREKISRANFLKLLGISSGFVLGIGGLNSLDKLLMNIKALAGGRVVTPGKALAVDPATPPQQPFAYIIYKRGLETVAQKYDGSNLIHGPISEVVIQDALNDPGPLDDPSGQRAGPGHIHILDGIYDLSSYFQGFFLRSFTTLTLSPQAVIRVPNGYAGQVFILASTKGRYVTDCTIDGGDIREMGPSPQRQWIAILLYGGRDGVLFNKFMNTTIRSAKIGIQLVATNDPKVPPDRPLIDGGWVNGNLFEGLKMWSNDVFIDFVMDGRYLPDRGDNNITGIHRNRFINIECQSDLNTIHGVRNIRHDGNSFMNVNIWDINKGSPGAVISNIHPDASGTVIISGVMTGQGFSDQGKATKIVDEKNPPRFL
jgi:hypothetical protein